MHSSVLENGTENFFLFGRLVKANGTENLELVMLYCGFTKAADLSQMK